MFSPDTLSILKYVLLTITVTIFGGCLLKIIFDSKDIKKSENVVALSMITTLCIIFMMLESFEGRMLASYAVLGGTVFILAKEMRKTN
jgi:hypothetical protein